MNFFKKFFQGDRDSSRSESDSQQNDSCVFCDCPDGQHEDSPPMSDEEVYDLMCSIHWDTREFFGSYGKNHGYRCDMRDGNSSGVDFSTHCCTAEELMSELVFPAFISLRESIEAHDVVTGISDSIHLMNVLDDVFFEIEKEFIERFNLRNELGDD